MTQTIKSLLELLNTAYDSDRHFDLLQATYEQERWFDTPRQRRAAELVVQALKDGGVSDSELVFYPADGHTLFQDWYSPYAWDCSAAMISIADTGELLGSRAEAPTTTVFYCSPLASAKSPAIGTIIDADPLTEFRPEVIDGHFILTSGPQQELKRKITHCKPLAIVSDWLGAVPGCTQDAVKWCNTWGDSPEGWYQHTGDVNMTGFNISPRAGKLLRKRLAANPKLRLSGYCTARVYEGLGQCPTGVIGGRDPSREIWLYAHDSEQGAMDNCSGVTAMAEALIMLEKLIRAGKLPRPRYSIRMFSGAECLGTMAFTSVRADLRGKALAGLYVDGAAGQAQEGFFQNLAHGPWANPTFGWAMAGAVADEVRRLPGDPYAPHYIHNVPTADDMIGDPAYNVPSTMLGTGVTILGYHTNQDTIDTCLADGLRKSTLLMAAWAYAMADLDRLAADVMPPAANWAGRNMIAPHGDSARISRWAAGKALRDVQRWDVSPSVYAGPADALSPDTAEPLDDLPTTGPIYRRKTFGNVTLERLPMDRRPAKLIRWNPLYCAALYWTDGKRPLSAVERLARAESGVAEGQDLRAFFDACVEAGNMEKIRE